MNNRFLSEHLLWGHKTRERIGVGALSPGIMTAVLEGIMGWQARRTQA